MRVVSRVAERLKTLGNQEISGDWLYTIEW